jgi:uncharacterized membrane protein YjgN (DUF898 family)
MFVLAAVWPALFLASMRFRLANTSWRGLRLRFSGDMRGAYAALLPLFAPALVFLGLGPLLQGGGAATAAAAALASLLGLATVCALPWAWWRLKHYQHGHYTLGSQRTQLHLGPASFYGLFLKTSAITVAVVAVMGLAMYLLLRGGGRPDPKALAGLVAVGVAGYAALLLLSQAFMLSRQQNMVWNATRSADLRFQSRLRLGPLCALMLKNALLVLLTLGLYWPFAAVALRRLQLQAVTIWSRRDPATLVGGPRPLSPDAAGVAADDLLGIDFGL